VAPVKPVVVIGLGNPLMSDEGVGVHVIRELSARAGEFPGIEFLDAGTSGMVALHAMAGRRKAVFVDCARMGGSPGTIRRFRPDDVASRKVLSGLSLHEGDLMSIIELSRRIGECPADVVIFGVEPECFDPVQELSPALASRLAAYVEQIVSELKT
jgi:hydrogenase maturation protease